MSDTTKNGRKINIPLVAIVASVAMGVIGWGLLAQSWAKDAGHEVILQSIDQNCEHDSVQDKRLDAVTEVQTQLLVGQTEQLANQKAMQKQLDRIESKLP